MLAYLFWHRPAADSDVARYEQAQLGLHRSLAARPPEGFRGSALYRAASLPWLPGADLGGYEDWYLLDDWAAVGVLRQAAVSAGHRTAHDQAARHSGAGAGGVFRLCEGEGRPGDVSLAVWVTVARGHADDAVAPLLLGDGLDRSHAGLWRRELVLGPAPEWCLLTSAVPAGVGPERLPAGWSADIQAREPLWPS